MSQPSPNAHLGEPLLDRWLADAARLAPDAGRERWVQEGSLLLRAWGQPHRRYHTVEHLHEVLAALDELAAAGAVREDDALIARVVAWFHDVHHDARATAPGSNEHRSATMARDHLHQLGVADDVVDAVEAGVLMTADHDVSRSGSSTALVAAVHDADLWILSAPRDRYAAYRRQVREEYAHLPEGLFRDGRSAILRGFAGRERLYVTGHAHAAWTGGARANVAAEIADLGAGEPA
ncbi:hypothetical protein [Ornithinimicrobium sp. LYQ103]|uniref:HD domain-containing protein n=1 Tax=Ornithinimicrobium sp. LYQ103 TaxID=3378796 RepID=UPI003854955A